MTSKDLSDMTIEEAQLNVDNALKEYEADRQNKEKYKAYKDALEEYQQVSVMVLSRAKK